MKYCNSLLIFILFLIPAGVFSQSASENWVAISSDKERITYVNVTGLSAFQDNEILVWVQEEFNTPLKMEEIPGKIFRSKSYYMINKELKRYSLVDVIYYDEDKNVLQSYHYNHNYENVEFKYTSPILKNSDMEKILGKCLEVINTGNNQ